tara:strand:- start:2537 stop:2812 length:276 start_codon:yes stop_codon:yes gene_type:complete
MNLEDYSFCGFKLYVVSYYSVTSRRHSRPTKEHNVQHILIQFKTGIPYKQWHQEINNMEFDSWALSDTCDIDGNVTFVRNVDECEVFGMLL